MINIDGEMFHPRVHEKQVSRHSTKCADLFSSKGSSTNRSANYGYAQLIGDKVNHAGLPDGARDAQVFMDRNGQRFAICFQRLPELRAMRWVSVAKTPSAALRQMSNLGYARAPPERPHFVPWGQLSLGFG